jgi:hypothetical protein
MGTMSAHRCKFIAYFRVSTDKQGKGGLVLEAQRRREIPICKSPDFAGAFFQIRCANQIGLLEPYASCAPAEQA